MHQLLLYYHLASLLSTPSRRTLQPSFTILSPSEARGNHHATDHHFTTLSCLISTGQKSLPPAGNPHSHSNYTNRIISFSTMIHNPKPSKITPSLQLPEYTKFLLSSFSKFLKLPSSQPNKTYTNKQILDRSIIWHWLYDGTPATNFPDGPAATTLKLQSITLQSQTIEHVPSSFIQCTSRISAQRLNVAQNPKSSGFLWIFRWLTVLIWLCNTYIIYTPYIHFIYYTNSAYVMYNSV